MENPVLSPFIYGRPVDPSEFVDREDNLRTIFNRLRNRESTAIAGEPHSGKSSLLLRLKDGPTVQEYLGDDAQGLQMVWFNLHSLAIEYTPQAFWQDVLEPFREHPGHAVVSKQLERAEQSGYSRRSLERVFECLRERGRRLVLLLDEFEQLLNHANFQDFDFFATIRSLASFAGSFAFITASRLSVAELNRKGVELKNSGGSPLFNIQCELRLHPFDEEAIDELLDQGGDALSLQDRQLVRHVAGRHPFLLQAMAACLVETQGEDRPSRAAESFYERVSFHFDDLWNTLDDRTRTGAVILCLMDLGGRALGQEFAYGEIERVDAFGLELRKLAERGLAEQVNDDWQFDWKHLLVWHGERWTVGAQAFTWWVRDVIISEVRRPQTYGEWLANKRYRLLLTQEQWDSLMALTKNLPDWAVRGVGALARGLFEELLGNRQP